jgi:monovalent cation:H+ antiporter-2, CPA2 family
LNSTKATFNNLPAKLKNHLIIIGFGINGQNLCKASKHGGIPYIIIELNPETVKREAEKGEPIIFGDAIQANILEHAHLGSARAVVIAISDLKAAEKVLTAIRRINKSIYVIVRTHSVKEMEPS